MHSLSPLQKLAVTSTRNSLKTNWNGVRPHWSVTFSLNVCRQTVAKKKNTNLSMDQCFCCQLSRISNFSCSFVVNHFDVNVSFGHLVNIGNFGRLKIVHCDRFQCDLFQCHNKSCYYDVWCFFFYLVLCCQSLWHQVHELCCQIW